MTNRALGAGDRCSKLEGGQEVQGLEAQNSKDGNGCRREMLKVRRRAGGAGISSIESRMCRG
jgi:hypothetical protein